MIQRKESQTGTYGLPHAVQIWSRPSHLGRWRYHKYSFRTRKRRGWDSVTFLMGLPGSSEIFLSKPHFPWIFKDYSWMMGRKGPRHRANVCYDWLAPVAIEIGFTKTMSQCLMLILVYIDSITRLSDREKILSSETLENTWAEHNYTRVRMKSYPMSNQGEQRDIWSLSPIQLRERIQRQSDFEDSPKKPAWLLTQKKGHGESILLNIAKASRNGFLCLTVLVGYVLHYQKPLFLISYYNITRIRQPEK